MGIYSSLSLMLTLNIVLLNQDMLDLRCDSCGWHSVKDPIVDRKETA